VLLIGTNNIEHGNDAPSEIADGIEAILSEFTRRTPNARILLLGLLPREEIPDAPMRSAAREVNKLLPRLAEEHGERVRFLEAGHRLVGADGTLSQETVPDFLHLNESGYRRLAAEIEPVVRDLPHGD
jgi:beta-glucosidase